MTEPVSGIHPDTAELQAYADGEVQGESVVSHVASCATCRDEVAAIRRVTAALSLGSKPPDSLTEKIRARRADSVRTPAIPPRRSWLRARNFVLPVGLAAAAVLAVFVPRALRESPRDEGPSYTGAKGALPADTVGDETIVTETGPTSIDSISWDISGSERLTVELQYVTGDAATVRAERLAERVAEKLREGGISRAAITVRPVAPESSAGRSLPAGAVRVTVRGRAPGT